MVNTLILGPLLFKYISEQLFLTVISLISNFLSALAGGGAGLIQLPALILLGLPFTKALVTHKIASVALGFGASFRHYKEKNLDLKLSLLILLFGIPGVIIGAKVVVFLPETIATFTLGILILSLGIYSYKPNNKRVLKKKIVSNSLNQIKGGLVITLIGILNGSLTSGTGLFLTLWLVKYFKFSYTKAVAHTLVIVGLAWNGSGAILLALNNEVKWSWLASLIMGSLIGGYLGAHFSIIKGDRVVKKSFEILTILMGCSLIIKATLT